MFRHPFTHQYTDAVTAYVQEKRRKQAADRVEAILDRTTISSDAVESLHDDRDASDRSFPQSSYRSVNTS